MKRVTGLGGFFFKCTDPKAQGDWYRRHLGIPIDASYSCWNFEWRNAEEPDRKGATVLGLFPAASDYFGPQASKFMCNFRVDDLDAVLTALEAEGVKIDPKREDYEYGRFAWIYDPEGNKVELWEPPAAERG